MGTCRDLIQIKAEREFENSACAILSLFEIFVANPLTGSFAVGAQAPNNRPSISPSDWNHLEVIARHDVTAADDRLALARIAAATCPEVVEHKQAYG